jgi:hypothetical protein
MATDAQKLANRRYYEKNREARKEAMRIRNREREAERREYLMAHPEALIESREKAMEKYYRGVIRRNRARIDGWLDDGGLSPVFKEFLRHNVLPILDNGLPPKFLDMCWEHLAIAVNPAQNNPPAEIDAPTADGQGR